MNTNFKFFAFAYLSDWWQYDAHFVSRLSVGNSFRRECLVEAATYYQVVRSFHKKREDAGSPVYPHFLVECFGAQQNRATAGRGDNTTKRMRHRCVRVEAPRRTCIGRPGFRDGNSQ
jgi:hypothetical protein